MKNRTTVFVLGLVSALSLSVFAFAADASKTSSIPSDSSVSTSSNSGTTPSADMPSDQTTDQQAGTMGTSTDTSSTSSDTSSTGAVEASTPKDVCKRLIEAAKKDDFVAADKFTLWDRSRMSDQQAGRMGGMKHDKSKMEQGFHKMHRENLTWLKDTSCGTETLSGDHAFVEVDNKQGKRLIPFVQQNGQWMFDAHTYMSFYPAAMNKMKSSS